MHALSSRARDSLTKQAENGTTPNLSPAVSSRAWALRFDSSIAGIFGPVYLLTRIPHTGQYRESLWESSGAHLIHFLCTCLNFHACGTQEPMGRPRHISDKGLSQLVVRVSRERKEMTTSASRYMLHIVGMACQGR